MAAEGWWRSGPGAVAGGGARRRHKHLAPRAGTGSRRRLPGTAVGALALGGALVQELAVDDATQRGRPALALALAHRLRRCLLRLLQVYQVVVRLAHARVLPLVPPAKEQLGTLVEEAACG